MRSRQWRFDYCIVSLKIAIEYQGSNLKKAKGRHQTPFGQSGDWEKINEAQLRGWTVILCNAITVKDGTFRDQFERAIKVKRGDIRYGD